jgi:hypothetical protein
MITSVDPTLVSELVSPFGDSAFAVFKALDFTTFGHFDTIQRMTIGAIKAG